MGVHETLKGKVVAVPTTEPLAINWTDTTLPSGSLAVADNVVAKPTISSEPEGGLESVTTGGCPRSTASTETAALVLVLDELSVTTAVRE